MRKIKTIKERFESKYKKTKSCWIWIGYKLGEYGGFYLGRPHKYTVAHRASYTIYKGDIGKYDVLHTCDKPVCVNPDHLFLGTHQDNMDDKVKKRRQMFGENHPNAKLTENDVKNIRKEVVIGKYGEITRICKKYKIFKSTAWCIIHKKIWKHI